MTLKFCVDPKYMVMKASQTIQVLYIVNAMYFASLKFSGIFRVFNAYTVQSTMRIILYNKETTIVTSSTWQRNTLTLRLGY